MVRSPVLEEKAETDFFGWAVAAGGVAAMKSAAQREIPCLSATSSWQSDCNIQPETSLPAIIVRYLQVHPFTTPFAISWKAICVASPGIVTSYFLYWASM